MSSVPVPWSSLAAPDANGIRLFLTTLDHPGLWFRQAFLCSAEQSRASRYRFPEHAKRFAHTRCALRLLLGHELGVAPDALVIEDDADGRPYVDGAPDFNLSHDDKLALVGIAGRGQRVGIDVERAARDVDPALLSRRLFGDAEADHAAHLSRDDLRRFVVATWTRKEAVAKYTGEGIRRDLRTISFGAEDEVLIDGRPVGARVAALHVGSDYTASVCWGPGRSA